MNVDSQLSVYRQAVGKHANHAWKGFVGWPLLVFGVISDIAAVSIATRPDDDRGGLVPAAVTGVALTALGGWLVYGSTIEDQAGAGTQWHP